MTDEPYRWLEAIGQRREYVESRLAGGTPVLAASLDAGILLLGVGTGQSKVFEVFDRHAMAGLGHPADLERLRQAIIDAAHLEAFTRAPEDVSLRRLVSFGLAPLLKTSFEQLFSPPILARALLAELGPNRSDDTLARVDFDGSFHLQKSGTIVVAAPARATAAAERMLEERLNPKLPPADAAQILYAAWQSLSLGESPASASDSATALPPPRIVELALLQRSHPRPARFVALDAVALGLIDQPRPTP